MAESIIPIPQSISGTLGISEMPSNVTDKGSWIKKTGNIVMLHFYLECTGNTATLSGFIPEGFRPPNICSYAITDNDEYAPPESVTTARIYHTGAVVIRFGTHKIARGVCIWFTD